MSGTRPSRGRRWTSRDDNPAAVETRRKAKRQDCPVDLDCDWSAELNDVHALIAHLREHK